LYEYPQAVVAAHLEMMPRILAEESMARSTEVAVSRTLKRDKLPSQWTAWRKAAHGTARAKAASATDLKAMGVGYRTVGRNPRG
jgi:hypothetical protein